MAVVGEKGSVELAEGVLVRAGKVVLVGVGVVDSGTVSGVLETGAEMAEAILADDLRVLEVDVGDETGLVGGERVTPEKSPKLLVPTSRQQLAQNS